MRSDKIIGETVSLMERELERAFADLLRLIDKGKPARDAVAEVMGQFNGKYAEMLQEGFSKMLGYSVGVEYVREYPIGKVTLSERLYWHAQEVGRLVEREVVRHAVAIEQGRDVALRLYDGYAGKGVLPVKKALPRYIRQIKPLARKYEVAAAKVAAAKLKTPALRAAYLEAIRAAERGVGAEALKKKLAVAFHEKSRHFASRIAQTELYRAYAGGVATELMQDTDVEFVQIRLSRTHPKEDICDFHANLDPHGLGPGVYKKDRCPVPPFHPFCRCLMAPRLDLTGKRALLKPDAERAYLAKLPPEKAARVVGGVAKYERVMRGATVESVVYANPDYPLERMGLFSQE